MVKGVVAAKAPVPPLQGTGLLHREHLLVDGLALPAQADDELVKGAPGEQHPNSPPPEFNQVPPPNSS